MTRERVVSTCMPVMLDTLKHVRGAGGTGLFAPGPAAAAMAGTRPCSVAMHYRASRFYTDAGPVG